MTTSPIPPRPRKDRSPTARSAAMPESHVLTVREVVEETGDARSVVLDVPSSLAAEFSYRPGQFLTVAVPSERTGLVARCYSLSSAPHTGVHQITVKRTTDGYASGWIVS